MRTLFGFVLLVIVLISAITFSRTLQVFLLYQMYSLGSGLDDGATALFVNNKHDYKPVILHFLDAQKPESYSARASFTFGEYLLEDPVVFTKIQEVSKTHRNSVIRCHWQDVLDGRFESVQIDRSENGKFAAYRIKDRGSKCK